MSHDGYSKQLLKKLRKLKSEEVEKTESLYCHVYTYVEALNPIGELAINTRIQCYVSIINRMIASTVANR